MLISQAVIGVISGSVLIGLESELCPAIDLICSDLQRSEDISGTFKRDSVLTIAIELSVLSSFGVTDSERLFSGVEVDEGLLVMLDDDDGGAVLAEVLFTIWTKS